MGTRIHVQNGRTPLGEKNRNISHFSHPGQREENRTVGLISDSKKHSGLGKPSKQSSGLPVLMCRNRLGIPLVALPGCSEQVTHNVLSRAGSSNGGAVSPPNRLSPSHFAARGQDPPLPSPQDATNGPVLSTGR